MVNYRSESKAVFVLETYRGIKFHFQGRYDYFKYHGKLLDESTIKDLRSSKEFSYCDRIQRGRTKGEIIGLIISNILYDSDVWLDYISDDSGQDVYNRWQKVQDSFSYIFMKDLKVLMKDPKPFNKYFQPSNESYPDIVQCAITNTISLETVVVLDSMLKFMNNLKKPYSGDFMFDNLALKVKSYDPFFMKYHMFDENKLEEFKKLVVNRASEQRTTNILTF